MTDAETLMRIAEGGPGSAPGLMRVAARVRSALGRPDEAEALRAVLAMAPGAMAIMFRRVPGLSGGWGTVEGMTAVLDVVEGRRYVVAQDRDRVGMRSLFPADPGRPTSGPREVLAAIRANADAGGGLLESIEGRLGA